MGKAKRFRWECSGGHAGILAPSRLKLRDVRRFCFPCSTDAGELVERRAPALDKQRASRTTRAKDKRQEVNRRKAARRAAHFFFGGVCLRNELAILCSLDGVPNPFKIPTLQIRRARKMPRSCFGFARPRDHLIHLTVWPGAPLATILGTLAHELAHLLAHDEDPQDYDAGGRYVWHGEKFRWWLRTVLMNGYATDPRQLGILGAGVVDDVGLTGLAMAYDRSKVSR